MTWFENLFLARGIGWAAALGDVAVRSTVLLAVAGMVALLLRRRPATVRHRVWTLALAGVLSLPVIGVIVPELPLSIPLPDLRASATQAASPTPFVADGSDGRARARAEWSVSTQRPPVTDTPDRHGFTDGAADSNHASRVTAAFGTTAPSLEDVALLDSQTPSSLEDRQTTLSIVWPQWVLSIWVIGAGVPLGRLLVGRFLRRRLGQTARPVTDPERVGMFEQIAAELEIRRPVQLLESDAISGPVTWGCWRAVVAVPAAAETWTEDKWRVVLLHELTHVRRGDCLSQLVSQLTCVVHWFNPLAWFGAASLRLEGERACDEEVLRAGTRASDYAAHLLDITQACQPRDWTASATVGMARRSQLEGRLLDILEPVRSQAPSTGLRTAASAVVGATILAVAAVQPAAVAGPNQPPQPNLQRPLSTVPPPSAGRTPADDEASFTSATRMAVVAEIQAHPSGRVLVEDPVDRLDALVRPARPEQTPTGVSAAVEQDPEETDGGPERAESVWGVAVEGSQWSNLEFDWDQAQYEFLVEQYEFEFEFGFGGQDVYFGVEQHNAKPLDDRVISAFIGALDDAEADVRRSAAIGLGRDGVERAVGPLSEALSDSDVGVREAAAGALGRIGSEDAVPGLVRALRDDEPRVAVLAAAALGRMRSEAAVPGLSAALDHDTAEVRAQIVHALGRIRSSAAVGGLVIALGDAEPDVRMAAAGALGAIRDAAAVEGLIVALDDSDPRVVRYAIRALARIDDERAIDALTEAVGHDDPNVRRAAIVALSGGGN